MEILSEIMPNLYRDKEFILQGANHESYKKGKIRHVGYSLWHNEKEKIKAAFAKENGEILITSQHGGVFGTAKIPNIIPDIDYSADYFITWGFSHHNNYQLNSIKLPSPYLSRLKKKYKKKNDDLLLVSSGCDLFQQRFDTSPVGTQVFKNREEKVNFISTLLGNPLTNLVYCPYTVMEHKSIEDSVYFKNKFPSLRLNKQLVEKKLLKCKLVVIDHPQTLILAALAANIPTIAFWDPLIWAESDQSSVYFNKLREAGVLHLDAKSAATKVNKEWDNIEEWWHGEQIQEARELFCSNYALTSERWWLDWMKVLWKL